MIRKTDEHEINRAGKRLLRGVLEPIGWVLNDTQEDYGIDSNVQVFDGKSPSGAWFHVQLKSSAASDYSADRTFISQQLSADHARHYALEMRDPVLLIHADVTANIVYWYAPQLDRHLSAVLEKTGAKFVTVRILTGRHLPATAPDLLTSLNRIYLVLASRELTIASKHSFAESIKHLPDQEALHKAFQEKNDTLKLQKIAELYRDRKLDEARPRAEAILTDPDSSVDVKFWARIQLQGIDYTETLFAGKAQIELSKVLLSHAEALQDLTLAGPKYLKFYALISKQAAQLAILVHENFSLYMNLRQHLESGGNPMVALQLYVQKSAVTKRITLKYNQCLRLVRYATAYPDRWMLGRAVTTIVNPLGEYLITLHAEENFEAESAFRTSALQICKVAAWICEETGDAEGVVLAIVTALITTRSKDSEAFRWATDLASRFSDEELREEASRMIDRAVRRWEGQKVEGDFHGDTIWQIIQNVASARGIDLSNEEDPLVRGLRIAASDDSPERILVNCEHLLVSLGATGPVARQIQKLFNITTAGSKVVHCTLHNFHIEGKNQDSAYIEFKKAHCDSCPDQKPRPVGWRLTDSERREIQARNHEFMMRLAGGPYGPRFSFDD